MTTTPTTYDNFINERSKGTHNFQADVIKVALTNTAPNFASDTVWSTGVYPAPAAANGYTSGGYTPTVSSAATTAGVFKLVLADVVVTATAGGIGPFQYAIYFNSSKSNKLMWAVAYPSAITLADTEPFTLDHDASAGVFTIP